MDAGNEDAQSNIFLKVHAEGGKTSTRFDESRVENSGKLERHENGDDGADTSRMARDRRHDPVQETALRRRHGVPQQIAEGANVHRFGLLDLQAVEDAEQ